MPKGCQKRIAEGQQQQQHQQHEPISPGLMGKDGKDGAGSPRHHIQLNLSWERSVFLLQFKWLKCGLHLFYERHFNFSLSFHFLLPPFVALIILWQFLYGFFNDAVKRKSFLLKSTLYIEWEENVVSKKLFIRIFFWRIHNSALFH